MVGGTVTFGLLDIAVITAIVIAALHIERRFATLEGEAALIKSQLGKIMHALGIGNGDEITQRRVNREDLG